MRRSVAATRRDDDAREAVALDRDARVAEILDEYLAAARAGRPLDREALLGANEDVRKELGAALTALEFVGRAGEELAADEERGAPRPEGTLGDFRLIREIGRGGMGVVYEAEQISLSRRVALKVLPFASVLDDRQLQRFKHEAQAAALLHHTNIVPVYSVGTERGVHYYAMEFVEGRSLAAVIHELRGARGPGSAERARARRPSPRTPPAASESSAEVRALTADRSTETPDYCRAVARLGVQAAEALDHAHGHDVVHRDVKPANLMVDAESRLWITDFGLARSRANPQLTLTGAIVGTLGYMSPEQALGKRVPVDHRTDVYSLGVTLIEALTLEPAFAGEDPRQVIQDIAFKNPAPPRRANAAVPQALETILLKAVAKDPEARYATAQEMADDLRRFLADEPIRARRAPILDRVTLWAKRHRAAVVAAACVLVIAAFALAADVIRVGAQRKRAEDAAAEAQRNAARAEANLAKAREAIDEMLTQLASKELAGVPGVDRVAVRLLEKAAALYDAMLASAGDDKETRLEAARAFARIAERAGSAEASERYAERARSLLVALAPADGPWHPALDELAHVERHRGGLLHRTARSADALPVLEHAVALAERGARERPDDPHVNPCLSEILGEQCLLLLGVGRLADAEAAGRRAVRVQEIAIERAPHDQGLREGLGHRLSRLGEVLRFKGSNAETEEVWRRAIHELEPAASQPADSNGSRKRAEVHLCLADLLLDEGRVVEAVPLLRVAAEGAVRFASEFPTYVEGHVAAAVRKGFLAAALFRAGQGKEAEEALADALARFDRLLDRSRELPEVQAEVAYNLLVLGNHLGDAGRGAEAEAAFRRAADLSRGLARATPARAAVKKDLAECLCNWVYQGGGRLAPPERLSLSREAVAAAEEATSLPDATPQCREALEWSLQCLGEGLDEASDHDGAADALRRAAEIGADRVSRAPTAPKPRRELAGTKAALSRALQHAGKLDEADLQLREALAILADVTQGLDADAGCLWYVATVAIDAADLAGMRGRVAEAQAHARRAVETLERMVALFPLQLGHRRRLATAIGKCGWLQLQDGKPDDAEKSYRRALDEVRAVLRAVPGDVEATREFVVCAYGLKSACDAAGRPADAEAVVDEAVRVAGDSAAAAASPENRRIHSDALVLLSFVRRSAGCDREALDAVERALDLIPYRRDAFVSLVLDLGDSADPACRDTRRAVETALDGIAHVPEQCTSDLDLEAGSAWNLLGYALVCDGRWKEGLEAAARSVELGYVEDGTDWVYEALAHAKLGELDAARELRDRAEAWFGEHPQPNERFGRRRAEVEALLAEAEPR